MIGLLGVAAGFGGVQFATADDDAAPTTTTTASTTTTTEPIDEVATSLDDVETSEDALAVLDGAPEAPAPGLSVSVAEGTDVEVVGSTAFLASSPDLAELGPPFLPGPDGSAVRLPGGSKLVLMIALAEPVADPTGLVAVALHEGGQLSAVDGPFEGLSTSVTARLGREDVIGQTSTELGFRTDPAPGSVRVDGPLLTFVLEPLGPVRVVIARGDDVSSLNTFDGPAPDAGPALGIDGLRLLGDVDGLVTELTGG